MPVPQRKGKKKLAKTEEIITWRLSDYVDRIETLHHSKIRLDTNKAHGQVPASQLCVAVWCPWVGSVALAWAG